MKILGIAGTNGSGKDTVSRMLADDYGWLFVSASEDLIIPELKKLGLPLEREQMSALGQKWREQIGMGAIVDKAYDFFKAQAQDYPGLVISSLRHPGEADRIHQLGGQVMWIDADPRVRFERINARGQGSKDQKSYEQFLAEEEAEMRHQGSELTLSMIDVKAKADFVIDNNDGIEHIKDQVIKSLGL